jgi:hypothetical protein
MPRVSRGDVCALEICQPRGETFRAAAVVAKDRCLTQIPWRWLGGKPKIFLTQ